MSSLTTEHSGGRRLFVCLSGTECPNRNLAPPATNLPEAAVQSCHVPTGIDQSNSENRRTASATDISASGGIPFRGLAEKTMRAVGPVLTQAYLPPTCLLILAHRFRFHLSKR